MNDQYVKHVGFPESTNEAFATYFSIGTVRFITAKISELLLPFYPAGVVVPQNRVLDLMNAIYEAYRPSTGDIMTRYVVPSDENPNCVDEMINQVIEVAVTQIKDNLETDQNNSKLSIWTNLYGTFNVHGLRSHAPIKVRQRRPKAMMFNMIY